MQPKRSGAELCEEHIRQRNYQRHLERVATQKPRIDNSTPASCAYTRPVHENRAVRQRQAAIDRENAVLVGRMVHVMQTKGGIDNGEPWRDHNKATSTQRRRQQEQDRIDRENAKLLDRLEGAKSSYRSDKLEADRTRNEMIASRISRYPYEPLDRTGYSATGASRMGGDSTR